MIELEREAANRVITVTMHPKSYTEFVIVYIL